MAILRMLPEEGSGRPGLSVVQIIAQLPRTGLAISPRTVQRDLADIINGAHWQRQGISLVVSEDPADQRVRRYSHTRASKALLFRAPSDEDLTMLALAEQELAHLLPPTVSAAVAPYLRHAGESASVRSRAARRRSSQYRDKLLVMPQGVQQIPPAVDTAHLQEITEALFRGEKLDVVYAAARNGHQPGHYCVHPVGLVKRGLFYYVVLVKDAHTDAPDLLGKVQTFRADRIRSVTRRRHDPVSPRLPSLAEVRQAGKTLAFPDGLIMLRLRIPASADSGQAVDRLRDAPLAEDQKITTEADGSATLTATVYSSRELQMFLLGLAHHVQVVSPASLREKIRTCLEKAIALHNIQLP